MVKWELKKITESKWFNYINSNKEITTEDFLDSLCEKCRMTILLQKGDNNDVGIYCVIKDKGLYGFTLLKNKFFQTYPNILKLNEFNGVETFILDKSQTITHFIEFLDSFLTQNQKNLKNVIDVVYYQDIDFENGK